MKTLTRASLTSLITCLTLLLLSACGDLDQDQSAQPGSTTQSECKPSTKADGLTAGTVKAEVNAAGTVTIKHLDAPYNCASRLQFQVTVNNQQILAREVIQNPGELARCSCKYDLSVPVSNLAPGTYKVTVQDADGEVVGATSVKVAGSSVLVVNSIQSACKGAPPAETYSASGALKVTVASGSVTILHEDAFYNCAHKVKLTAAISGSTIVAQEVIQNPKEAAFCMCHYDLSATLKNVPAGSYTVKVLDADGKLVDTVAITV